VSPASVELQIHQRHTFIRQAEVLRNTVFSLGQTNMLLVFLLQSRPNQSAYNKWHLHKQELHKSKKIKLHIFTVSHSLKFRNTTPAKDLSRVCLTSYVITQLYSPIGLAVWLSGNALVSINVVTLRWARLMPGWVTVFRRVNYLGI